MGVKLIAARSRAVIDLTQDDKPRLLLQHPQPERPRYPSLPQPPPAAAPPPPAQEEPASKRRRVESAPAGKPLRECLKVHLLPYVAAECRKLPPWCRRKPIAEESIIKIATRTDFRIRRERTGGNLTPEDEAFFAQMVPGIVWEFAHEPKFQFNAPEEWDYTNVPKAPLDPTPPTVMPNGVLPFPTVLPPPPPPSPPADSALPSSRSSTPSETVSRRSESSGSGSSSPPLRQSRRIRNAKRPRVGSSSPVPVLVPDVPPSPPPPEEPEHVFLPFPEIWHETTNQPSPVPEARSRPYRQQVELEIIRKGIEKLNQTRPEEIKDPIVYHVDFTDSEIAQIVNWCNSYQVSPSAPTRKSLLSLIKAEMPVLSVVSGRLKGRTDEDIRSFCSDLLAGRATSGRVLSLTSEKSRQGPNIDGHISSLLFARELEGSRGFGRTRRYMNFKTNVLGALEEQLEMYAQFANCAGDIATILWVSKDNLICGTTTHSDTHNQQYNKPGNLLLCSAQEVTLRAFPDHRIPRPIVASGDNSTHEMRQSQDPWLYSSVVCSDYDPIHKRAYTSSFDRTVKVWRTDNAGSLMECLATWYHDGNVNFVAAAKDGSGRVASGADVPTQAVRIYEVNEDDIAGSPYFTISCTRTDAENSEKWAYYPATMQWGKGRACHHILAVGYSPRSIDGDDSNIPDDKHNTGEIMLWDANSSRRIPLMTATTANVFEIVWHPVLERFIAATSPCGLMVEHSTRTQIHIFQRDRERVEPVYCEYQALDCPASDINELTIMPNSLIHAFVTAACTDGKVYVWDTAHSSAPIHILKHDQSLEVFENEHIEKLDTGVKFTAWGKTADHFYTGASDGVVRVWNVRNREKPYIRTLLKAPAPISCGAFSPDMAKLAIGDATGRLYLFSLDRRDAPEKQHVTLPDGRKVSVPIPFIPHAEPPPPPPLDGGDPMTGVEGASGVLPTESAQGDSGVATGRYMLETGMLASSGDRTIGVVKGPNYQQVGLFRREAHENEDPTRPLLTHFERVQQESVRADRGFRRRSLKRLREPSLPEGRLTTDHAQNTSWESSVHALGEQDMAELASLGAILSLDDDYELAYESGSEC